jgi:hypothetical protein
MRMSFRYKLSSAINNIRSWNDKKRSDIELFDQVTTVMQLSRSLGLSISLARLAQRRDPSSHDYNCFMWAFGLWDKKGLTDRVPDRHHVYPRSDFAVYLVDHYLEEIYEKETRMGDIVIYFKDGDPVHAGIWDSGLVISKWGLYSHLWKHGVCELPIEYGEEIRFYRSLSEETTQDALEKWYRHLPLAPPSLKNPEQAAIAPGSCTDKQNIQNDWMG